MSEKKMKRAILFIGNDSAKMMKFRSDDYEWVINASQLPIIVIVKSKKDGATIRIFTIETVEEKIYEE